MFQFAPGERFTLLQPGRHPTLRTDRARILLSAGQILAAGIKDQKFGRSNVKTYCAQVALRSV